MSQISEKIKQVRSDAKLSQSAFAKKIGVSVGTVVNYESGKTKPGKKVTDKIRDVFGADILKSSDAGAKDTALSTQVEPDIVKPAEPSELSITIQAVAGGSITIEEIVARVHAAAPDATEIYVKTEENKAYYVGKKNRGFVILWE